ncbi:MAG: hypothetical protein PF795_15040 [Kiritimatiellae bacterium]|jgi:hypothetical protein|nr:hypothetical protein [Kiritimatiellia bacterium]
MKTTSRLPISLLAAAALLPGSLFAQTTLLNFGGTAYSGVQSPGHNAGAANGTHWNTLAVDTLSGLGKSNAVRGSTGLTGIGIALTGLTPGAYDFYLTTYRGGIKTETPEEISTFTTPLEQTRSRISMGCNSGRSFIHLQTKRPGSKMTITLKEVSPVPAQTTPTHCLSIPSGISAYSVPWKSSPFRNRDIWV